MKSFWTHLKDYPPVLCRLLAKDRYGSMSDEDISISSGLSLREVQLLNHQVTWKGVPIDKVEKFLKACHLDLTLRSDRQRARDYMRKGGSFAFLLKAPHYQPQLHSVMQTYMRYLHANEKRDR